MTPITLEWVQKAESDYDVVLLLRRSRKRSRFDPICFHAQQCVEKYIKARLIEAAIRFPKTHDLALLINLALSVEPQWALQAALLSGLDGWSVLPRYPGVTATADQARAAFGACRDFRAVARLALGLRP